MSTRVSQLSNLGAGGNLSRRDQAHINRDPGGPAMEVTTVSFTAPGTISDSASGFLFGAGDDIEVRGSALNSRVYVVTAATSGALTVVPALIQTEAAGPDITIVRTA